MLKVRPLQIGDIEKVRQSPLEEAVKRYPDLPTPDNNAFSFYYNDKIVAVGGVIVHWEGVGEMWTIISKDFEQTGLDKLKAFLTIRAYVNKMIEDNKLWRTQAFVRVDNQQALKMVMTLGFEIEGYMRKYAPDKTDMYLLARIK